MSIYGKPCCGSPLVKDPDLLPSAFYSINICMARAAASQPKRAGHVAIGLWPREALQRR